MEEALPERPDLHQTEDALRPLGPWAFLREAVAGGLGRWGLQLMAAWALLPVLGSAAWAQHLRAHAGNSALPNYWGEMLTARDAWELAVNGQLERAPLGFLPGLVLAVLLLWALWAGWKLQARTVELEGRLLPWLLGRLDALLLAALPLARPALAQGWPRVQTQPSSCPASAAIRMSPFSDPRRLRARRRATAPGSCGSQPSP